MREARTKGEPGRPRPEQPARGGDIYLATSGDFDLAIDMALPQRGRRSQADKGRGACLRAAVGDCHHVVGSGQRVAVGGVVSRPRVRAPVGCPRPGPGPEHRRPDRRGRDAATAAGRHNVDRQWTARRPPGPRRVPATSRTGWTRATRRPGRPDRDRRSARHRSPAPQRDRRRTPSPRRRTRSEPARRSGPPVPATHRGGRPRVAKGRTARGTRTRCTRSVSDVVHGAQANPGSCRAASRPPIDSGRARRPGGGVRQDHVGGLRSPSRARRRAAPAR